MDTQTALRIVAEAGRDGNRQQVREAAEHLVDQQLEHRVVVRLNHDELSWSKVVAGSWSNCDCDHEHCAAKTHRFIGTKPSFEVALGGDTFVVPPGDTIMLRRKTNGGVVAMVEIENGSDLIIRDGGRRQSYSLAKIVHHWNDLTIRERTFEFAEPDGFDAALFRIEEVSQDGSVTILLDAGFEAAASSQFRQGEQIEIGLQTVFVRRKGTRASSALMALHIDFDSYALHLTPLPFAGFDAELALANHAMILTPVMLGFIHDAMFQLPLENRVLTMSNGRDYRTTLFRFEAVDLRRRTVTIVLDDTIESYDPPAELSSPKLTDLNAVSTGSSRAMN